MASTTAPAYDDYDDEYYNDDRFTVAWYVPWLIGIVAFGLFGRAVRPPANIPVPPGIAEKLVPIADPPVKALSLLAPAVAKSGVKLDDRMSRSLGELDALFQTRPDLQAYFGSGETLSLNGLILWALSGQDSGAFRLATSRPGLQQVATALAVSLTTTVPPSTVAPI